MTRKRNWMIELLFELAWLTESAAEYGYRVSTTRE